jgi:transposase
MTEKLKLTREQMETRRLLAAQMFQQGKGVVETAHLLGVSKASVSRWKTAFEKGGSEALHAKKHPGPKPRLTARQKKQLVRILLRGPLKAGYANDLWTCPRVVHLIEQKFGVHYHAGYVWYLLRDLGWTAQMPEQQAREGDEVEQDRWRREEWPRIKRGPVEKRQRSHWRMKPASCSSPSGDGLGPREATRLSKRRGTVATGFPSWGPSRYRRSGAV